MRIISLYISLLSSMLLLSSCEDVIEVAVTPSDPQLVIDGFITNRAQEQTIRLTQTVPYFYQGDVPTITGAQIILKNQTTNKEYLFNDTKKDGIYSWTPIGKDSIGKVGDIFLLQVTYKNETFVATSSLNLTVKVDSITYDEREEGPGDAKAGYYAKFFGKDSVGQKDFYWIKAYRNDKIQPQLLNYSTNGIGIDQLNISDGFRFIPPIQERITDPLDPYKIGDVLRVEIWSITEETLFFLVQADGQINNEGLFARPPENIKTNFINKTPGSKTKPVGWFNTSVVSSLETIIKQK